MTAVPTHARRADPAETRAIALVDALATHPAGSPEHLAARAAAIEAWRPMARRLAQRYARHGEALEDLVQVASVGLIRAVDRFDAGRGTPFTGFAIPTIAGELKRHFRDRTWSIRVPRRLQELRLAITAADNTLSHTLGRGATVADVAAHLGITEEAVIEGLEGARAYRTASLSAPTGADGEIELGDTLGTTDPGYLAVEEHESLQPALATLDERDRRIIALRFYGNLTQTQIATELDLSQMHVSRLLRRALGRLRTSMDAEL